MRGREVRTTVSNPAAACPLDRVNQQFHAPRPNALWLSDFTYVAIWQGFVYVAFVTDAYARRIGAIERTGKTPYLMRTCLWTHSLFKWCIAQKPLPA